jgi:hypothetical protein
MIMPCITEEPRVIGEPSVVVEPADVAEARADVMVESAFDSIVVAPPGM